ncbi:LamB/YcsF family protein [Pseudooceanicola nanhaiensis]|uniref:LamB/YcsF family protein n=1 Tax=Pseudooceanicola nanhaiensis TaxID=375761 RepID=UPI001CD3486A|nr:5-oxoprolinase subunit PxpA [Pseudooceanicola nanhaiensis]MCA0919974.1 LamB/YcsF family protein [Pseudooceanicola nanhaiensis]
MKVDINSDLGESYGRWTLGDDEGMMKVISSANVACGYHGGDALTMTRCVELAKEHGVALGSHCGLPDLLGFGRVPMDIDPRLLSKHFLYQHGALEAIAKVGGYPVSHCSTHGAMGEMGRRNPDYDDFFFELMAKYNPELKTSVVAGSISEKMAQKHGLATVGKVFADRAYDDEGNLVNRKIPNSVIHDLDEVQRRIVQFLDDESFTTITGGKVTFKGARSILVHSDTTGAVEIAQAVRDAIESGGGEVVPFTELC